MAKDINQILTSKERRKTVNSSRKDKKKESITRKIA